MNMGHKLSAAINAQLSAYRAARCSGDDAGAWRALEIAHIMAQTIFWPHVRVHGHMLGFAWARRDGSEIIGQIARLLLAPIGNITGRLPIGNNGRANVSAFAPMPIADDVAAVLAEAQEHS